MLKVFLIPKILLLCSSNILKLLLTLKSIFYQKHRPQTAITPTAQKQEDQRRSSSTQFSPLSSTGDRTAPSKRGGHVCWVEERLIRVGDWWKKPSILLLLSFTSVLERLTISISLCFSFFFSLLVCIPFLGFYQNYCYWSKLKKMETLLVLLLVSFTLVLLAANNFSSILLFSLFFGL